MTEGGGRETGRRGRERDREGRRERDREGGGRETGGRKTWSEQRHSVDNRGQAWGRGRSSLCGKEFLLTLDYLGILNPLTKVRLGPYPQNSRPHFFNRGHRKLRNEILVGPKMDERIIQKFPFLSNHLTLSSWYLELTYPISSAVHSCVVNTITSLLSSWSALGDLIKVRIKMVKSRLNPERSAQNTWEQRIIKDTSCSSSYFYICCAPTSRIKVCELQLKLPREKKSLKIVCI